MGNIDIEGSFDRLEGECSLGSVSYSPMSDDSSSRISLEAELGSVKVSGVSQGNSYKQNM